MKYFFAGCLLFAQFGHYLDMEFGTRMPLYCGAPVPNQPSPYAEPYLFKINLLVSVRSLKVALRWLFLNLRSANLRNYELRDFEKS